jgi:hypothetical protein
VAAVFEIAEGKLTIDADTTSADRVLDKFFLDNKGRLHRANGDFASNGERAGWEYARGLNRGFERNRGGFLSGLLGSVKGGISAGIGSLRELGSTLRDVGEVASTAGGFLGGALKLGGIALAIPTIIAVAGALSKLIGLLALIPSVVGVAVAAIAPLVVAFQGMGDALGAAMSGDVEKLNESLKKLAPSAREFVREFARGLPMWRRLGDVVQESFFKPVIGGFTQLTKFLLPTLQSGMSTVAGSFGRVARGLMELFASNDVVKSIGDIFAATGRIIDRVGPSMINLIGTFVGMAQNGLPFVERMFDALADGMDKFSGFLSDAMSSGDFERWLEGAFSVMKDLWELTKALGGLLGSLFGPTADEGQTFIQALTEMTRKLEAFFRSAEGVQFLENMVAILHSSSVILGALAGTFIFLMELNNAFVRGLAILMKWFADLDDVVGGWLDGAGGALSRWWDDAVQGVINLGSAIGTFIAERALALVEWARRLPETVVNALLSFGAKLAEGLGFLVGSGIRQVLDMPGKMQAGWDLLKLRASETINALTGFFMTLPDRVGAQMQRTWATVTGWFTRTRDDSTSRVREMFNSAVSFASQLGPRIMGAVGNAGNWLRETGRNAIRGLVEGISDMLGWLVDRARAIGESIVRGFKRGLEARSPSQRMRREVGRTILPGIEQGMRDTMGSLEKFMGDVQSRIASPVVNVAAPNVSVGGHTFLIDNGDGVYRAARVVATQNPQIFASATDEGRRQRTRDLGARAKA